MMAKKMVMLCMSAQEKWPQTEHPHTGVEGCQA